MVGIAIVIVKIPFEGDSRSCLSISGFGAALLFVTVAIVPACPMLRPWSHTHPAKFILTFPTTLQISGTDFLQDTKTDTYQVMWLHPPFFSIVDAHFGHSFVLAE